MLRWKKIDKPPVRFCDPHGSDFEDVFHLKRDDHYNSIYEKVGERDLTEYINSFKTGCSLKAILDRCQLLPVHDKIRYMQQREDGYSADLSNMPSDGVEAQIMLQDLRSKYPDIYRRSSAGESLDSILKSYEADHALKKENSEPKVNNSESEVNSNG